MSEKDPMSREDWEIRDFSFNPPRYVWRKAVYDENGKRIKGWPGRKYFVEDNQIDDVLSRLDGEKLRKFNDYINRGFDTRPALVMTTGDFSYLKHRLGVE